jgi:CheY-like chemotaxis protein
MPKNKVADAGAQSPVTVAGIGASAGGIEALRQFFDAVPDDLHQGATSLQSGGNGLGIGLTLAKSLVEMHGGTITAASAGVDLGTEFRVELPVTDAVDAAAAARAAPISPAPRRRVLIVDDNQDAAQSLCLLLQMLGEHEVRIALNGAQALAIAAELRPEIVLLDLMMPGMDGFEVAARMRREPWGRDIRLVALTGWGQEDHRRRTREAGFDRHLTKPADVVALEDVLCAPLAD